eukprot:GHVS01061143.1.p1 GENE.GHVS01061143.1~~GHVS01061143.1.p1  ORF type:complete len:482 (+),score=170.24 GHVS01061143.1:151-1446(+)
MSAEEAEWVSLGVRSRAGRLEQLTKQHRRHVKVRYFLFRLFGARSTLLNDGLYHDKHDEMLSSLPTVPQTHLVHLPTTTTSSHSPVSANRIVNNTKKLKQTNSSRHIRWLSQYCLPTERLYLYACTTTASTDCSLSPTTSTNKHHRHTIMQEYHMGSAPTTSTTTAINNTSSSRSTVGSSGSRGSRGSSGSGGSGGSGGTGSGGSGNGGSGGSDVVVSKALCNLVAGRNVLDVGCFRGGGVKFMCEKLGAKSATGVDLHEGFVKDCPALMGKELRGADGEAVRWECADVVNMPFGGECFDVVVCVSVLGEVSDVCEAAVELCRVLTKGGHLVVVDAFREGEVGVRRFRQTVLAQNGMKEVLVEKLTCGGGGGCENNNNNSQQQQQQQQWIGAQHDELQTKVKSSYFQSRLIQSEIKRCKAKTFYHILATKQ